MALQPPGWLLSSKRQTSSRRPPDPPGPPGRRGRRILPGCKRSLPRQSRSDAGGSLPAEPRRGLPLPTHLLGGVYLPLSRQLGQPQAGGDDISTPGSYAYLRHTWRKSPVLAGYLSNLYLLHQIVGASLEFPLGLSPFDLCSS